MALDVGTGGDDRGIAIDTNDHVGHVHGFIAKLATPARGDGVFFGCDLTQRSDGDIVFGENAPGKLGIAVKRRLLGLALHIDNLANRVLVGRLEVGPGVNGHMLGSEGGQGREG